MLSRWASHDLPNSVLSEQAAWDRRHRVRIAYICGGVTYRALGAALGLGPERIRQLVHKADREARRGSKCPAEVFINKIRQPKMKRRSFPKTEKAISRLADPRDWLEV